MVKVRSLVALILITAILGIGITVFAIRYHGTPHEIVKIPQNQTFPTQDRQ